MSEENLYTTISFSIRCSPGSVFARDAFKSAVGKTLPLNRWDSEEGKAENIGSCIVTNAIVSESGEFVLVTITTTANLGLMVELPTPRTLAQEV